MDNERKQWRQELRKKLSELVVPAKDINQLGIDHPNTPDLLEDVIRVLRGNDGGSPYISGNESLELFRLYGLLQWIVRTEDIYNKDYPIRITTILKKQPDEEKSYMDEIKASRHYPDPNVDFEK